MSDGARILIDLGLSEPPFVIATMDTSQLQEWGYRCEECGKVHIVEYRLPPEGSDNG